MQWLSFFVMGRPWPATAARCGKIFKKMEYKFASEALEATFILSAGGSFESVPSYFDEMFDHDVSFDTRAWHW